MYAKDYLPFLRFNERSQTNQGNIYGNITVYIMLVINNYLDLTIS